MSWAGVGVLVKVEMHGVGLEGMGGDRWLWLAIGDGEGPESGFCLIQEARWRHGGSGATGKRLFCV